MEEIDPFYLKQSSAQVFIDLIRPALVLIATTYLLANFSSTLIIELTFFVSLFISLYYVRKAFAKSRSLIFTTTGIFDTPKKFLIKWSRVEYYYFVRNKDSQATKIVFKLKGRTKKNIKIDITESNASIEKMIKIVSRFRSDPMFIIASEMNDWTSNSVRKNLR